MRLLAIVLLVIAALSGCGETAGSLVTFHTAAAGPVDAAAGQPLVFTNGLGYSVTLTTARLHVGAIYVNRSVPTSGSQAQPCILPGIYSGQETSPLDVDVLSPALQFFPALGEGTADPAFTGEVWLFGSQVDARVDPTVLVDVEGTATSAGVTYPFSGQVTISSNRAVPVSDPSLPGASPLCKQRIVTPIPVDLTLAQGGTLIVRADPRIWFINVDFAQVPPDPADATRRRFLDETQGQADIAFYAGVRSTAAYTFQWQSP